MKEHNPLSVTKLNLERFLTRLPGTQPLSPDQSPKAPFAHIQKQQENPHHLSQQNHSPEDQLKRVK